LRKKTGVLEQQVTRYGLQVFLLLASLQAGKLTSYYILNSLLFRFSLRTLRLCGEEEFFNLGIFFF
jgi:hypothetical protein